MAPGRFYGMFPKAEARPKYAPGWSLPPAQQMAFENAGVLRSGLIKYGVVEHVDLIQHRPPTQALPDLYLLLQEVHRTLIVSLVGLSTIFTELFGLYSREDQSAQYLVQVIDNFVYVSREFIAMLEDAGALAGKAKKLAEGMRKGSMGEQERRDGIREWVKERVGSSDKMTVCRNTAEEFLVMFEDVALPILNYTLSETDDVDPRLSLLATQLHSYAHVLHAISLQLVRERPEVWESASANFVALHRLGLDWGGVEGKAGAIAKAVRKDTETFLGQKGQVSLLSRQQIVSMMDCLHGGWEWRSEEADREAEVSGR